MTSEITKGLCYLKLFGMATNWPEIVARSRHDLAGFDFSESAVDAALVRKQ